MGLVPNQEENARSLSLARFSLSLSDYKNPTESFPNKEGASLPFPFYAKRSYNTRRSSSDRLGEHHTFPLYT